MAVTFKVPHEAALIIDACKSRQVRNLLYEVMHELYVGGRHYLAVGSVWMQQVVTRKQYGRLLSWIERLGNWTTRTERYVSSEIATDRNPAECKAFRVHFDQLAKISKNADKTGHNTMVRGSDLVERVVTTRDWYRMVRLRRKYAATNCDMADVFESAAAFDGDVNGYVSEEIITELKRTDDRETIGFAVDQWRHAVDAMNSWGTLKMDGGGRIYTPVVQLKKQIRRGAMEFTREVVDSDGEVFEFTEGCGEVDVDYCHFFHAALVFSPADEREKLIGMLESDEDFYLTFADENLERNEAKVQLLRSLFEYNCNSPAWRRFSAMFPRTAYKIHRVRDQRDAIRKRVKEGRTVTTHIGQRRMSRILTRVESKVFNRAIARLWRDHKIPAVRLHDAIMVRRSLVKIAEEYLQESYLHFYGRKAPLSVDCYGHKEIAQ